MKRPIFTNFSIVQFGTKCRAAVQAWWRSCTLLSLLVLAPGAILAAAGLTLLVAPQLAVPFLAVFLVVAGVAGCVAAWRLVLLKRRAEEVLKQVEVRVTVQAHRNPPFEAFDETRIDQKKVVLH